MKDWLRTGRSQWYVAGNYEPEKAIELVDKMRSIMSLESAKLETLPHLRGVALESGTSFLVEKAL